MLAGMAAHAFYNYRREMNMITISQADAPAKAVQGFVGAIVDEFDADSIKNPLFDMAYGSEERQRLRSVYIYELNEWLAEIRELAQSYAR